MIILLNIFIHTLVEIIWWRLKSTWNFAKCPFFYIILIKRVYCRLCETIHTWNITTDFLLILWIIPFINLLIIIIFFKFIVCWILNSFNYHHVLRNVFISLHLFIINNKQQKNTYSIMLTKTSWKAYCIYFGKMILRL